MMMISALCTAYPSSSFADVSEVQITMQTVALKGQVVTESGEPVIGASVMLKGTSNGTITDLDGNFILNGTSKGTLVISFIGYITQEIPMNGKTSLKVVLKEDTKTLDEVVVIGYGTQRKEELTSSVMSVKAENFVQVTTPDAAGPIQAHAECMSALSSPQSALYDNTFNRKKNPTAFPYASDTFFLSPYAFTNSIVNTGARSAQSVQSEQITSTHSHSIFSPLCFT